MRVTGISFLGGFLGFGLGGLAAAVASNYIQAGILWTSVAAAFAAFLVLITDRDEPWSGAIPVATGFAVAAGSLLSLFGPVLIIPHVGFMVFAALPAIAGALAGFLSGLLGLHGSRRERGRNVS